VVTIPFIFHFCLSVEGFDDGMYFLKMDWSVGIVFVAKGEMDSIEVGYTGVFTTFSECFFTVNRSHFSLGFNEVAVFGVEVRGYISFYELRICVVNVSRL